MRATGGDGQTAAVGVAFSAPLQVKAVGADGSPVAGAWVGFSITGGSGTPAGTYPIQLQAGAQSRNTPSIAIGF